MPFLEKRSPKIGDRGEEEERERERKGGREEREKERERMCPGKEEKGKMMKEKKKET